SCDHPATHKHPHELLDSNLLKSDSVATSFNQGCAFYANLLICQAFLFRFFCLETAWRSTLKLFGFRVRAAYVTGAWLVVNPLLPACSSYPCRRGRTWPSFSMRYRCISRVNPSNLADLVTFSPSCRVS